MFSDIIEFHEKFDLLSPEKPTMLEDGVRDFRYAFMVEELEEFENATYDGDLVKAADALADLIYVALGTAYLMGLPMREIWDAVHRANMTKVRAKTVRDSKRGSTFDVVKPEGFVPPDATIKSLLELHGWTAPVSTT